MQISEELKLLMLGVAITLFFRAGYRIIDRIVPDNFCYDMLMIAAALLILYFYEGTIKVLTSG